jgi:hypothetical protein
MCAGEMGTKSAMDANHPESSIQEAVRDPSSSSPSSSSSPLTTTGKKCKPSTSMAPTSIINVEIFPMTPGGHQQKMNNNAMRFECSHHLDTNSLQALQHDE